VKMYILVADLGSSKTELVLYDGTLTVLDSTGFRTPFEEQDGVKTIDPKQYMESLIDAADRLAVPRASDDTLYVSTTGMGSTVLAASPVAASTCGSADEAEALTPALSWETSLKDAAAPAGGWTTVPIDATGKTPLPTYPLFKIPELRRRLAKRLRGRALACFVSLHDYIWACMTGSARFHTDFSLASRGQFFHTKGIDAKRGFLTRRDFGICLIPWDLSGRVSKRSLLIVRFTVVVRRARGGGLRSVLPRSLDRWFPECAAREQARRTLGGRGGGAGGHVFFTI